MQLYNATVRVGGSLFNEVPKFGVTAAEIEVLRRVHGGDSVVRIVARGEDKRDDETERARLQRVYGRALLTIKGAGTLDAVLGTRGVPLPKTVPGVDSAPAPKRGRPAKADDLQVLTETFAPVEEIAAGEFQ